MSVCVLCVWKLGLRNSLIDIRSQGGCLGFLIPVMRAEQKVIEVRTTYSCDVTRGKQGDNSRLPANRQRVAKCHDPRSLTTVSQSGLHASMASDLDVSWASSSTDSETDKRECDASVDEFDCYYGTFAALNLSTSEQSGSR